LQVATDVAAAAAAVVPCIAATWHNKFQICYETCIRTCPSWRPTLSQQPPAVVLGENFHVPATFTAALVKRKHLHPEKRKTKMPCTARWQKKNSVS